MGKTTTVGEGSGITSRTRRLRVLHARLIETMRARYKELKSSGLIDPHAHKNLTQPRTSEFSYLFQCVRHALLVENYIQSRPWEAVSLAMDLMELLTEFSFKEAHERDALDGREMNEGRIKGGKSRRRQPRQERVDFVNALVEEGSGKRKAMRDAAKHFGVSYSAISKDCYPKK